jgi:hypothetical protein
MEASGQIHAPTPVAIKQEAGLDPEPVWTFWRSEKSHATAGIRTPALPAHSLVVYPQYLKKYVWR